MGGKCRCKKSLINNADFVFTASPSIEQFNKSKQSLLKNEVNDLLIHCSDAHQFSKDKNTTSKDLAHCFTWIKSQPTFEGLKQIIYKPEYRLQISQEKPINPLCHIENINLDFVKEIKFRNDTFCFAGISQQIQFSPNFTCVVRGRGSGKSTLLNLIEFKRLMPRDNIESGKSTLLNLIAKKINILDTNYFNELNKNESEWLNSVKITPDNLNNVEYLAQNTIEQFATDISSFSNAIFERINKMSKDSLKNIEDDISDNLKLFDNNINRLKNRYEKHKKLQELKKSLKNYINIVNAFAGEKYVSKKDKLHIMQKEYTELLNSIKRLCSFLEIIYEASTNEPFDVLESQIYTSRDENECNILEKNNLNIIKELKNEFDKLYNATFENIQRIYEKIFKTEEYQNGSKMVQELKKQSDILKKEIHSYLKKKGIQEESIQDIQKANENIEKLKLDIKELKKEILSLKKDINNFSYVEIDINLEKFNEEIQKQLRKSNTILKGIVETNQDVKIIEIQFNTIDNIFERVFNEFEQKLNLYEDIRSYRETFRTYLKEIEINKLLKLKTVWFHHIMVA